MLVSGLDSSRASSTHQSQTYQPVLGGKKAPAASFKTPRQSLNDAREAVFRTLTSCAGPRASRSRRRRSLELRPGSSGPLGSSARCIRTSVEGRSTVQSTSCILPTSSGTCRRIDSTRFRSVVKVDWWAVEPNSTLRKSQLSFAQLPLPSTTLSGMYWSCTVLPNRLDWLTCIHGLYLRRIRSASPCNFSQPH